MWQKIAMMLLPYALDILMDYIKSSSNKYDDKVLDIVKSGCGYLASQNNNDVTVDDAKIIDKKRMYPTPDNFSFTDLDTDDEDY